MKLILESTPEIARLVINGAEVPARIWRGVTESGIECHAYVTRIAVDKDADCSLFDRELRECPVPSVAIPLRLIL